METKITQNFSYPVRFLSFSSNSNGLKDIQIGDNSKPKLASPIEKDTVELSKNPSSKPNNKKKILLGIGAAALAIAGCAALIRINKISNAKKELTKLYDTIFEDFLAESQKFGINIEKPKLVFTRMSNDYRGCYIPNTNQINVDPRVLLKNKFEILKDFKKVKLFKLSDEANIPAAILLSGKKLSEGARRLTHDEMLASTGEVLYHELTHARQLQMGLSMEGGREKIIAGYKKRHPELSEKSFKKAYAFLYNYKPSKIIPCENNITELFTNERAFSYTPNILVNSFIEYIRPETDGLKYYTNPAEISARIGERNYWLKMQNGKIPKPNGVDDEFIKYNLGCTNAAVNVLLNAFEKCKS